MPLVNEKPVEEVDGAVVEEPNTKPVDAVPWLEVTTAEAALGRVLLPSPKLLVFAVDDGVAAALLRLSFGVLSPREKPGPAPGEAGAVLPKLKPGVCVVGAWVLSEKRPVEGVDVAGWEGVPKVNAEVLVPVPAAEKEKPVAGVVVEGFAAPNVKPPAEAPGPPKLKPLMAAADPSTMQPAEGFAPALSTHVSSQPRPPQSPPLLPAAMEPFIFTLVPIFTQLSNLPSCLCRTAAAASIALHPLSLCLSHVTPGDPGTGAGQNPAPS